MSTPTHATIVALQKEENKRKMDRNDNQEDPQREDLTGSVAEGGHESITRVVGLRASART